MERESVLTAPSRMDLDGPVLVVIGGLPGSGKTTLLRRLLAEQQPGATGLDSAFVAERFRQEGICLPYRFLRPWVHLEVGPEPAAAGQSARGRVLSDRAMRRHVERSSRSASTYGADVLRVDRRRSDTLRLAEILAVP